MVCDIRRPATILVKDSPLAKISACSCVIAQSKTFHCSRIIGTRELPYHPFSTCILNPYQFIKHSRIVPQFGLLVYLV